MTTAHVLDSDVDADVLVVGYGPVGQSLAVLLGALGHRVLVCERRRSRYDTPRAVHLDHEVMRIFQSMGIAAEVRRVAEPARTYEFLSADGTVISELPRNWSAPSGWDASYHFYQPELELVLDQAVARTAGVEVLFGVAVTDLRHDNGRTAVLLENGQTITARWVIGADGANSRVRAACGIGSEDLGFEGDWLVVDLRPLPGAPELQIPDTGQVLNPARPNHMARVANRYFRWEFMLVDGDKPAAMVQPERVWQLLAPWIGPEQGQLIRQVVYQFRSVVADTFRQGSVLLAGDAAHLMPPFLGQGLSSGVRDAATLAWMLDLVLTGAADPRLLDLYTDSRRPHVTAYIEESMRVGAVVCETDPERADEHRRAMMSATETPAPFSPPVGAGFRRGQPLAGTLAVQPLLRVRQGQPQRSDDVLGYGFTLLSTVSLDRYTQAALADLGPVLVRSAVIGTDGLNEVGSAFSEWMSGAGVVAVLVRPDFYVFGTAAELVDVPALLHSLRDTLSLTSSRPEPRPAEAGRWPPLPTSLETSHVAANQPN